MKSTTAQPKGSPAFDLFAFVDAMPPEAREAAEEVWSAICTSEDLDRSYAEAEAFERWGLINDLQMVDNNRYEFLWPTTSGGYCSRVSPPKTVPL